MRIIYSPSNKRLVNFSKKASSDFWDQHWNNTSRYSIANIRLNQWVVTLTRKYVSVPGRILEGGCGIGDKVYALQHGGYDTFGVDFAQNTIQQSLALVPDLKLSCQDVRKLSFPDHYFDGYWSLGVIEHFQEGFSAIAREMKRVLKPSGYIFLTVPIICPMRRIKILFRQYDREESVDNAYEDFYQYMYSRNEIVYEFENRGFRLVKTFLLAGLKGLKDEIRFSKPFFQNIYDSNHISARISKHIFEKGLSWLSGHSRLFVFKKVSE